MKQLFRTILVTLTLPAVAVGSFLAFSPQVSALAPQVSALDCAILPQSVCGAAETPPDTSDPNNVNVKPTGLFLLLRWVLTILTAVVGIAAIGTIIWAGIMYASAADDSGQVAKAKTLIRDVIIGVIAYGLMIVGLNWLVPGGVIG